MFRNHSNMNRRRTEITVIGVLIVGVIVYGAAGLILSATRVADAERALNAVVSHQPIFNSTFSDINTQLSQLSGSSAFNPDQAIILVDKSVSNSQAATKTIEEDDVSLASASSQLGSTRWLTLVAQSSLDREASRIRHARNALGAARTIADDELQDGHFWHSLYAGLGDLTKLLSQSYANDMTDARTTLGTMKTDIDSAAQLSIAPGLPAALHDLMADMQTFVADFGKQLDAKVAGDDASAATFQVAISADLQKISGGYDFDKIGADITAFYKPLLDRFNSEIAVATS
jgi:hypothetical protein